MALVAANGYFVAAGVRDRAYAPPRVEELLDGALDLHGRGSDVIARADRSVRTSPAAGQRALYEGGREVDLAHWPPRRRGQQPHHAQDPGPALQVCVRGDALANAVTSAFRWVNRLLVLDVDLRVPLAERQTDVGVVVAAVDLDVDAVYDLHRLLEIP